MKGSPCVYSVRLYRRRKSLNSQTLASFNLSVLVLCALLSRVNLSFAVYRMAAICNVCCRYWRVTTAYFLLRPRRRRNASQD